MPQSCSAAVATVRTANPQSTLAQHIYDNCASDLCGAGGWMHIAHLTRHDIMTLVRQGSEFIRVQRHTVLRAVLTTIGQSITPARCLFPSRQSKRQAMASPQEQWTAEHASKFRHYFPDNSVESTALNIMLYAMPSWNGLVQFGWKDIAQMAIQGSRFSNNLVSMFRHMPDTRYPLCRTAFQWTGKRTRHKPLIQFENAYRSHVR